MRTFFQMISKYSPNKYLGRNFVSKWVILSIDLLLIAGSLIISYTIIQHQHLDSFSLKEYYKGLLSVVAFALVGHYMFKPHRGIIRHTSLHDIKRVFFARTFSFLLNLLFILVIAEKISANDFALPFTIACINYFISLYLLVQFRLAVKYIFNLGKRSKEREKAKVIIYGAGEAGQLTFNTLIGTYDIVAFIDDSLNKKGKTYSGVKILHSNDDIQDFVKRTGVSQVVISVQNCSSLEKRAIINRCADWELEVKVVPPIEKWVDGELTKSQIRVVNIEDLLGREVIKLANKQLAEDMTGKTVLVTGAGGSIGSEISRQLALYEPSCLVLLDQAETPLYHLELELATICNEKGISLKIILADIRDEITMNKVFNNYPIDCVFHAAAYKHVPAMETNPLQAVKVNILGTRIVADLSEKYGVKKMVFVSTDKAVNPTNVMGASKRAAEMYVQSKNRYSQTSYITTRFGNVLGSNGSVIPLFKKQIDKGGPVTVTHPEITRYFMTIPEACQLVLEAGHMGKGGEIFVFDMGESMKIYDLAKKMIRLSGFIPEKEIKIEFTGLRPGEKLYEELLNDKEAVLPTHHEKIMIAKVVENKLSDVKYLLDNLEELIHIEASEEAVVSCLKQLVPEFVSQNSHFQKLDRAKDY